MNMQRCLVNSPIARAFRCQPPPSLLAPTTRFEHVNFVRPFPLESLITISPLTEPGAFLTVRLSFLISCAPAAAERVNIKIMLSRYFIFLLSDRQIFQPINFPNSVLFSRICAFPTDHYRGRKTVI